MKFKSNRRQLITIFIILVILCEVVAYEANTQRPKEQYFQLYVLGAGHSASGYYPYNQANIAIGRQLAWYVGATNNMGNVQLISIRVKLANETVNAQNDQPSPSPVVTDFARFLKDNETWEIRLNWNVSKATIYSDSTRILALQINNQTYQISDCSARYGHNFRLIFELWTWQVDSSTFEFGWTGNGEHHAARVQLWFNMTTTTLPP